MSNPMDDNSGNTEGTSALKNLTVKSDNAEPTSLPVLSWEEKKEFCDSLKGVKRRCILISFPYSDSMGDVKSTDVFNKLQSETRTTKAVIDKASITEEIMENGKREVYMAINVQSKNAILVSSFLWKVYQKVFPDYHYQIQMDVSNTSSYLDKARTLVAPLEAREMDMKPFVFGETLYELLRRIENAMKSTLRSRHIESNWKRYPLELQRAVLESNRNWLYFIRSSAYKSIGSMYPYTCRRAFDAISDNMPYPRQAEPCKEDPIDVRRRESRERQTQRMWDDLYDPVMSKRQKVGNIKRMLVKKS